MKDARVGLLLTVSIFVMAAMPLAAAFYLLQDALRISLNLGFNPQVVRVLEDSSDNLRTLGRLDEANRAQYRSQFDEVEELKQIYSEPELVKQRILDSLQLYFGLGLGAAVLLSVGVASLLSRRIARSHALNIEELSRERDKVRYLQEMSSWQELAKMLAHEIKNPLTPIEVLVTSLSKAYLSKGQPEFLAHLTETQTMISEELQHLKSTVNKFSEFARMPQVQLADVDLVEELDRQIKVLSNAAGSADFEMHKGATQAVRVRLDVTLFRQVLANIVRNGVEANPGRRVRFTFTIAAGSRASIRIANDGIPVQPEIVDRMFDPYISTKTGKDNMGLGLAIVKKIVLEHGGDIRYEESHGHPAFVVELPCP
ncbi:MAG TPA: HAMP domain-containing sensor histidine kinase [Steroidobacteraceae bacterium]|nr:HAMP domain-containing sensor histidine kinase [Steroidobacteraceae bacterium]